MPVDEVEGVHVEQRVLLEVILHAKVQPNIYINTNRDILRIVIISRVCPDGLNVTSWRQSCTITPTHVYGISHFNCVPLRHLCVGAFRPNMSMSSINVVACIGHPPELITVGVNRPGLGEQFPICLLHLAP